MHASPSTPPPRVIDVRHAVDLRVRDVGRMTYAAALDLQRRTHAIVVDGRRASASGTTSLVHLLLVEHDPPVITVSRRPGARRHLLATDQALHSAGVEVAETDRGGDITYHGPGQLVVYPILDLNNFGLRIDSYMRLLEQIIIDVLGQFGLRGEREPGATGVWVRPSDRRVETPTVPPAPAAKICAMGVRISRWVSMHGLALNVTTNLDHFNLIVPCGLAGRSVTSMRRELDGGCPSMPDVKRLIADTFEIALRARFADATHQRT